jgi:hypothetical protein
MISAALTATMSRLEILLILVGAFIHLALIMI